MVCGRGSSADVRIGRSPRTSAQTGTQRLQTSELREVYCQPFGQKRLLRSAQVCATCAGRSADVSAHAVSGSCDPCTNRARSAH